MTANAPPDRVVRNRSSLMSLYVVPALLTIGGALAILAYWRPEAYRKLFIFMCIIVTSCLLYIHAYNKAVSDSLEIVKSNPTANEHILEGSIQALLFRRESESLILIFFAFAIGWLRSR